MTTLSDPTIGLLMDVSSRLDDHQLERLFMRADLWRYIRGVTFWREPNTAQYILNRAQEDALNGDGEAHRGLLNFTVLAVQEAVYNPDKPPRWFSELCDGLLADGYQLRWTSTLLPDNDVCFEILPTDAQPTPLANEITAFEAELERRRYAKVLTHYRQAVDNFVHHNYEAANGQLRTALEALVVQLATDNAGYVGHGNAGEGGNAINWLVDQARALPDRDGGTLLRGLWQMTHTNGSHPGQSTPDEARFRMQVITATARFLLNQFHP